jgi:peptide/nickel transport system substrate-binding protein
VPPTDEPAEPNIFVFVVNNDMTDLDPAISWSDDSLVMANCYETLTIYNPPGSAEMLSPGLATSWESNEDATVWTFHIREGVTFHNGDPLNAQAVKDAIDATYAGYAGAAYIWWPLVDIVVLDEYTVQFNLFTPANVDMIASSMYAAWIYNAPVHAEKGTEWLNEGNCVGTGPYTIESYEGRTRLVMTRYDDYWGGWDDTKNQFDKVVFEVVYDANVRQQMIESGVADMVQSIPVDNYEALEANPDIVLSSTSVFANDYAYFNTAKPPLDDVRVRQALVYAFPWDDVINEVFQGSGVRAYGMVPQGMFGSSDELFQYPHDMDKAAELLADAGYPDGGFTLTHTYVAGAVDDQQMAELWGAELAQLGITLDIQGLTWVAQSELAKSSAETAQDIFQSKWWPDYVDPFGFLWGPFACEETINWNFSYWCDPEFDGLIYGASALTGTDRAAAAEMYADAQAILVDDAVAIFIADLTNDVFMGSDIQGYVDNPAYNEIPFVHQMWRE